jgi:hypothetical protein
MVNKLVIGTTIGLVALSSCNYAVAETPCDYTKDVSTNWTKQIQKTENVERNVFPYVESTRKCVMTMDITIDGQTYPAEGSYVFGPDMTENNACDNATVNAKKTIISQISPEILSSTTEMNCSTKENMPVVVASPQPKSEVVERPVVITESQPVVSERIINSPVVTERIISRKVIDSTPVYVVDSNSGLNISNFLPPINIGGVTVSVKTRQRGKCYADWSRHGGVNCY